MDTRIRALAASAAVVFALAPDASAQSAAVHRGAVYDHTARPVPGVVVTVAHPHQTAVRVALTDLRGQYEVAELERDTRYNVLLSHPDFRRARLRAKAGETVRVQLKPRRSSPAAERRASEDERR